MQDFLERHPYIAGTLVVLVLFASVVGIKLPSSSPDNRSKGGTAAGAKGRKNSPIYVPGVSPRPNLTPKPAE